jgi:hypothetical protein
MGKHHKSLFLNLNVNYFSLCQLKFYFLLSCCHTETCKVLQKTFYLRLCCLTFQLVVFLQGSESRTNSKVYYAYNLFNFLTKNDSMELTLITFQTRTKFDLI